MSSRGPPLNMSSKKASAMTTRLNYRQTTKFPKHSKLDFGGTTSMFVQENSLMQPPSQQQLLRFSQTNNLLSTQQSDYTTLMTAPPVASRRDLMDNESLRLRKMMIGAASSVSSSQPSLENLASIAKKRLIQRSHDAKQRDQ